MVSLHKTETAATALAALAALMFLSAAAGAAPALFRFKNPANRFAPASGRATLDYFDPDATGWGPTATIQPGSKVFFRAAE